MGFKLKNILKSVVKTIANPLTLFAKPAKELGKKVGLVDTKESKRKLAAEDAAAEAAREAAREADRIEQEGQLKDPAATILGGSKFELNPLAAPSFDSASVEEARRRSLLKQRMRGGRASTIMSDRSY